MLKPLQSRTYSGFPNQLLETDCRIPSSVLEYAWLSINCKDIREGGILLQIPVLTDERIHSIVQSEAIWTRSRLTSMQEQFSNPGIQIARFGNAFAFVNQSLAGNPIYNRVIGLTAQDEGYIDPILQWYAQHGIPCQIDLCPYQANQDLLLSLAKHGLYQSSYDMVLYGIPSPHISPLPPHIVVRTVHPQELDLFSDLFAQGFLESFEGFDVDIRLLGEYAKGLYGRPGWHLYLTCVEETPAAVALLYREEQIASLVAGATVPQFRGRGCQTALIQRRIADAAHAGCTLLVTQTRVGTTSQHNMERAGMRIAYTKAIWKTPEQRKRSG